MVNFKKELNNKDFDKIAFLHVTGTSAHSDKDFSHLGFMIHSDSRDFDGYTRSVDGNLLFERVGEILGFKKSKTASSHYNVDKEGLISLKEAFDEKSYSTNGYLYEVKKYPELHIELTLPCTVDNFEEKLEEIAELMNVK